MLEFLVRLGLALVAVGTTAAFVPEQVDIVWRACAIFCAYSVLVWQLEKRGIRNPGLSGFIAVADSAVVALIVAKLSGLEQFGFLVLAPIAYAAARHGSNPAAMAPIASAWILVAANLTSARPPSNSLLAQTVAVLGVGLLLSQARIVMTVTREIEPTPAQPTEGPEPIHFMELRENFRRLRDYARDLDRRSRRDRIAVQIFEAAKSQGDKLHTRLAGALRDITGAQGLTLHTVSQIGDLMVVRGTSGEVPTGIETVSFDLGHGLSEYQTRARMDQKLRALRDDNAKQISSSVLLRHQGRIIGMLSLTHESTVKLEESVVAAQEAATFAAAVLNDENMREARERRLQEVETLYGIAATVAGAETSVTLGARVVRELFESMTLKHLGISVLDDGAAIPLAHRGAPLRLVDELDFGSGKGIDGWRVAGFTEVVAHDAMNDPHLDRLTALKKRVGSFCLLPIQFGPIPYGFMTASTNSVGGLDSSEIATLRAVAAELGRALGRLEHPSAGPEGLCNPKEFQEAVALSPRGCLIYLEPLRQEELIESYGKPAVDHAVRILAGKLLGILPAGGALCRRPEGDLVAFLKGAEEAFARSWANEATATASMVPLRTPDGRVRIPLGLRAKVAQLALFAPHSHEISREAVNL